MDVIDFLNLIVDFGDDWKVTKMEANHKDKIVIMDLVYVSKYYEDPMTFGQGKFYDYTEERTWRHLDILDYHTYVRTRIPRVKCEDGSVKQIRIGWAEGYDRHTYQFEIRAIELLLITKNQTKTAEYLGCTFRLINRIMHRCTERGMARRCKELKPIQDISIDEKSFKRGHEYVTVLSHPRSGIVLDVSEGRTTESAIKLIESTFNEEQRQTINTVSMDMWPAYLKAVDTSLPESLVVHDRFHLVKNLNEGMDKVRRRESPNEEILKGSRYSLLKNEENMTQSQKEKFEIIKKSNLDVTYVWHIRENFKKIFHIDNNDENALELLKNWAQDSFMYGIKEVNNVIMKILNNYKGVVNAMISNYSNAMAERLNGKIQEVKICSRGYRTFENFRSAILFFHGGLNLLPQKW